MTSEDRNNPERLVSVKTEAEATLIAGMLEQHGIEATVTGGYTSGFKAGVPSEVRVLVRRSDLSRAQELLEEARDNEAGDQHPDG